MNLRRLIDQVVADAMAESGFADAPAVIKQAARPEFGHYQANGIMGAAKKAGRNPREVAADVVARLEHPALARAEIAGPGFINLRLNDTFLETELASRLGGTLATASAVRERIAVDYSSPNLAKEMHVGHLRSTVIGDALVRILEYLGNDVIRVNHVGDWGAQFGSLLAHMDELDPDDRSTNLRDLENFYRAASARFKNDPAFAEKARGYVVLLQSGDPNCLALWRQFIEESIRHCEAVCNYFNITLKTSDIRAESAYNDDLAVMVAELEQQGLITESDGAKCVFLPGFEGKDGKPLPAIVQKSDGGFPYLATDIAAVRYRVGPLAVDKAWYVVGSQQKLHLQQLFAVATAAGYITDQEFRHIPFGWVLKSDGKPFKTRDGADVKLIDVLEEAVTRAHTLVSAKNPALSAAGKDRIAHAVGTGAVKYAELSKNRLTDYIFDWDTMLSFEGNTAPYLQYAYTRVQSIFRRAGIEADALPAAPLSLTDGAERRLALKLLQYQEAVESVLDDCQPNLLCNYLYELAQGFMSFYEACPVVGNAQEATRLRLCALTARTLAEGLNLLGILTVDEM